jgi:digeranylgeranylglycerophospholipid reductase
MSTAVDALVVGAGPAGTAFAERLAAAGRSVVVVEEHPTVGRPVQCAGLVSQRVLDLAGSTGFVEREVRGASVVGPSGRTFAFRAESAQAFAIDRAGLDVYLADKAARAGAEVRTATRFDGVAGREADAVRLRLTSSDGAATELAARLVVGADGVASAVARAFRLRRPMEILPAFEAEFPNVPGAPDLVEVYLGRQIAPGLFGWSIPDGRGGARVGVAADADGTPARRYYEQLLRQIAAVSGRELTSPTSLLASGIPIGAVPRIVGDRVLLVGDAAAQVKPLSGGGIYTGMRAAQLAADVALGALRTNDLSAANLARYPAAFDRELGEEFRKALYLRRLFVRLSDPELDALVDALIAGRLEGTVVAFGDIDFPTHVARQLLRASPGLVRLLPKALGAWVSSAVPYPAPDLDDAVRRK